MKLPDYLNDDRAIMLSDIFMDAYRAFDSRQPGWMKVELKPDVAMTATA